MAEIFGTKELKNIQMGFLCEDKKYKDFICVKKNKAKTTESSIFLIYNGNILAEYYHSGEENATMQNMGISLTLYDGWYESPESVYATAIMIKACGQKLGLGFEFPYENKELRTYIWGLVYKTDIDYEGHMAHMIDYV